MTPDQAHSTVPDLLERLLTIEDDLCGDERIPEDIAVQFSSLVHRHEDLLRAAQRRAEDASQPAQPLGDVGDGESPDPSTP
jgi:hypothetical protein